MIKKIYDYVCGSNLITSFLASAYIMHFIPWYWQAVIMQQQQDDVQHAGFFFTLFLTAVFFVIGELMRPKPDSEAARPANIGDFQFPTAEEGRVIPLLWGTVRIKGPNVLWYGDLGQIAITQKVKTGMFSSKRVTTGFRYNVGIQFALCRGPIDEITGVWIGEDKVFTGTATSSITINEPLLFGGDEFGQGGVTGTLRIHLGTTTQTASSYLSTFQQQGGDTPTYRGTAYCVFEKGYIGNSPSIKPWAFEARRLPNPLSLTTGVNELNSGNDLNPVSAIYELLTNDEWGLDVDASDIDTTNFTTTATTLQSENNGFSMAIERPMTALDLLRELERQIDGVVFLDKATGLWKINLARPGQTPVATADETNVIEVRDFSRIAWEDTTNQIRIRYSSRVKEYKETFALAQDMANRSILGGVNTSADANYPGVKDDTLANNVAWRDMRTLARPLAKATLVVDRTFWDISVGDLIAWTNTPMGITALEMRVIKTDLGELANGRIVLTVVEDIFSTDTGSFSPPLATGWIPPTDQVVDIPAADRIVFEAPKAFVDRAPVLPAQYSRMWAGARSQGKNEIQFDVVVSGTTTVMTVVGFLLAGKLNAAITKNSTANWVVKPDPDTQADMVNAFSTVTNDDKGEFLSNLCLINNEFVAFTSANNSGANVSLNTPTRGLLDSTPEDHAIDDLVYMLFVAGNISDNTLAQATQSTELLPESPTDKLTTAEATAFNVTMDNRALRPYPPIRPTIESTLYNTGNVSLDTNVAASDDGAGFRVDFTRRDYRTTHEYDAQVDESTLPADFPSANTTEYRIEIIDDPLGTPTSLFHTAWTTGDGTEFKISRTEILANNSANIPSKLGISIETRHTVDSVVYTATQHLDWEIDTISNDFDAGDTNLGVRANGVATAAYTVQNTGNHTLRIGHDALVNGTIQENVNSGGWVNTGLASGTTSVVRSYTATDSVQFRVNGETPTLSVNTIFEVDDQATGDVAEAYGVFTL